MNDHLFGLRSGLVMCGPKAPRQSKEHKHAIVKIQHLDASLQEKDLGVLYSLGHEAFTSTKPDASRRVSRNICWVTPTVDQGDYKWGVQFIGKAR